MSFIISRCFLPFLCLFCFSVVRLSSIIFTIILPNLFPREILDPTTIMGVVFSQNPIHRVKTERVGAIKVYHADTAIYYVRNSDLVRDIHESAL